MTAVLEARNVQVVYGDRVALDVEHLALHRGETLALIGPNGAGKSTLLRVLALLQAPARGEVWFEGAPVARRDLPAVRRRLAVVFQEPLLRDASVWDNVATGLWFRGERGPSARKKVEAWLERLGLTHLAHRSARTLSGGEARRVSLARALVLDPEVLLLDEPLSALDAPTREALVADLEALLRDAGTTTLLVTHERSEALLLGTRVGVLVDGRLRQIDTPAKVFGAPVDEEVAAFVGVENVWEGQVVHETDGLATLRVGAGEVRVAGSFTTGQRVVVCLRPEEVVLALPPRGGPTSARNVVSGRVTRVAPVGSQFRVTLDCGFPLVALVTRVSYLELGLRPGLEVLASFKASALHVLRR